MTADNKLLDKAVCHQLQIDHAPHLSPRAKTIKLADKIANYTGRDRRPSRGLGPCAANRLSGLDGEGRRRLSGEPTPRSKGSTTRCSRRGRVEGQKLTDVLPAFGLLERVA